MALPFVDASHPGSLVVLVACSSLALYVRRSGTGLVLAWWQGSRGRARVLVGEA